MQYSAARMQKLIVDLLAFSRVRTHAQPFQPINLNETVTAVLQDLELHITELDATFDIEELPTLDADGLQMRQLFQNLISTTTVCSHLE